MQQQQTNARRWAERNPDLGTGPLPVSTFTSQERYALEQERVFRKAWLMIGRVEEMPKAGDYKIKRLEVANTSIILMRARDGEIRGFHNVCSHRANEVLAEKGGDETFGRSVSATMYCSFHGWVYNAKGELVNIPQEQTFHACLDKGALGLTTVHTGVWNGFIFINLSAEPEQTLEENLREFDAHLGAYPFHDMNYQFTYTCEFDCNWKVGLDGFSEIYHLAILHSRTLPGSFTEGFENVKLLGDHRTSALHLNGNAGFTELQKISNSHATVSLMALKAGTILPPTLNPDKMSNYGFELSPVFPNSIIHCADGIWFTHQFWPLGHRRMRWEGKYYVRRPEKNSQLWAAHHAQTITRNVWLEDGGTMEAIQRGLESGAKKTIVLQDEEILIRHNHHVLERYINA
jgi:phenylpropionate dioxygenase-like ring-hydroxylating dioxygenase large terminal subunit